jgi:hypothetical protein
LCPYLVPLEEYSDRFARHLPTTYADTLWTPTFEQCFALFESEIGMFSEIRTEENDFVFMFFLHGSCSGREYGVDAAYTIAHFPTSFEYIFWLHRDY